MRTRIKTASEISAMRESGRMLAAVLQEVAKKTVAGVSTKELALVAANELNALGGKPAFLGYQGFPDVICISVNEEIVHGIPNQSKVLRPGDIVGLDFGVIHKGMLTDGAISVGVGTIEPKHRKLLEITSEALRVGVDAVHDKVRVGDISAVIQTTIEKAGKYGIPRELVGHGVGHQLWEEPNIPNYGRPNTGPWLDAGMTIAIEPMVTLGTNKITVGDDGWTITTADGSWAAHFEHTVLITADGAEILTQ